MSHSAGRQTEPFGSPCCSESMMPGPLTPGTRTMSGLTVDQLGSPAEPVSLPHQRTSGPASENITARGCIRRTSPHTRGQSYSCFLPFGPSPFAPSNHTSWISP